MDIDMPTMDGYQACEKIRERDSEVPVIFLSGKNSLDDKLLAFDSGGDDFFSKPLENREILQRIILVFEQREQKQQALKERSELLEVAQRSMTDLSYLGEIINFLQKTFHCSNYEELSQHVFSLLESFGLQGTLLIRDGSETHCYFDDGVEKTVELILMASLSPQNRILEFGNSRAAFNWKQASLLIKNMPEDVSKAGSMRDYLAYVMNGVEECVLKIMVENKLSNTVEKFKIQNDNLKYEIANLIEEMEVNLELEFSKAGLDDDMSLKTEDALIQVVRNTRDMAFDRLEKGKSIEKELDVILDDFKFKGEASEAKDASITLF
jgi:CheY-like chemotaxis protein